MLKPSMTASKDQHTHMLQQVLITERQAKGYKPNAQVARAGPAFRPSTVRSRTNSAAVSGKEAWWGSTGGWSGGVPRAVLSVPGRNGWSLLALSGACTTYKHDYIIIIIILCYIILYYHIMV